MCKNTKQHVNRNRVNQIFLILFSRTIELERMKEANKTVKVKVHSRDLDQVCIDIYLSLIELGGRCSTPEYLSHLLVFVFNCNLLIRLYKLTSGKTSVYSIKSNNIFVINITIHSNKCCSNTYFSELPEWI